MEFLDLGKMKSILSIFIWRKHMRNIPCIEFKVEIFLTWGGEFGATWQKVLSDYFAAWCFCYFDTFKLHKQFYDGPWVKLCVSTTPMSIYLLFQTHFTSGSSFLLLIYHLNSEKR